MEQIIIGYRPAGYNVNGVVLYHTYLAYVDNASQVHFLSGKPTTVEGSPLQVLDYTYDKNRATPVFDENFYLDKSLPQFVLGTGNDLRARWRLALQDADNINATARMGLLPYDGLTLNSNSVTMSAMMAMGYSFAPPDDLVAPAFHPIGIEPTPSRTQKLLEEYEKQLGIHCFPADVRIQQSAGTSKAIRDVVTGDIVSAYDSMGCVRPGKVVRVIQNVTDMWIKLSNGLVVTPGHLFLTPTGAFCSIGNILEADGAIVLADGTTSQVTGRYIYYSAATAGLFEQAEGYAYDVEGGTALAPEFKRGWKTYNFEVEDLHTYIAGGVRVHNASPDFMLSSSGQKLTEQVTLVFDQQSGQLRREAVYLPPGYSGPIPTSTVAFNPAGYKSESTGAELFQVARDRYDPDTNTWSKVINFRPAPSQAAGAAAVTSGSSDYRVNSGDTLSQIAQSHGTTVAALMQANPGIADPNRINAGQTIHVPQPSSSGGGSSGGGSSGNNGGTTYVSASTGQVLKPTVVDRYDPDTNTWGTATVYKPVSSSSGSSASSGSSSSGSNANYNPNSGVDKATQQSSWWQQITSPLLLDLDGNGLKITAQTSSNMFIDVDGDGKQHRTAWAGAGDGVLVRDAGNDGIIKQKNEIDFSEWDPTAKSDMQALRDIFDTNHNNQLDSGDTDWSLFKVMVTNADGTTSLQTLSSLGIASINLISNNQEVALPDGSTILGTTTYNKTGGGTGTVADTTLSYNSNGYVVAQTVTHNGDGSTTVDNKATDTDGSLANETTATTSASGLSVTTKFDDDGDGVFDRVETRVTVANGDGSHTETLSRYDGSGTILGSKQVTTTSADTKTVSISRDSTGSGSNDQTETDVINGSGDQTVTVTDLNRNASTHDKRITTTSADGLSKTIQTQLTGSGAVNATSTVVTSVAGDGTRTETRTDYAGSGTSTGNRIGKTTTVINASGSSQSVATDADGDGLTDLTVASTIVVNGDGSRTTTQTGTNRNSTLRSKVVTLISADGLTTTVQTDADGDGNYESTSIDAKVLNLDGSTTETVTHKDVNSVTIGKSVSTWSADGKTRTVNVDSDGDGVNDQVETVAIVSTNSVDTTSVYSPNGTTLLSKSVATTSADGLTQTTQTDANGDGTYDAVETATTVINVDHSSTLTVITKNGAGTIQIGKTVTTTSADGLSTTTQNYLGTAGSPYATVTDVQVLNGDSSTTETVTTFAGTSNVQTGKQVTTVSADRLTVTVKSYLGTNSLPEAIVATVTASDGSQTRTESHYNPTGSTLVGRTTTSISADGLTSTIATDVNGDGVTDSTQVAAKVLNSDGTTTVTTTVYAGSGTSADNKVSQSVVTTSGNGLSVTAVTDLNGDGVTDSQSTDVTVLNADGSKTETVTTFNGDGTIQTGKTVLMVSDDGLSKTQSTYLSNHGTADAVTTDAITFATDGSTVETVSAYTGNGSLRNKRVTTTSANGLSSTTTEDLDGNASTDRQTVNSVSSNGSTVSAVSTFGSTGSLTSKSTTTVSGNGLSTSVVTDLNGDTVTDLSLTDAIVLNADGSKAETLSNFKAGGVLKDKTVVTTTADGLSVTTQWDITGGGTFIRSATDVTAINANGSTTETLSNLNAGGSLHDKIIVTTSADKRSVTTTHDLNGDATVDQTIAQVQNADGSVLTSSMDGSVLSASGRLYGSVHGRYQTVSADGLSTTIQYDANGNSLAESQTTDVTVIHTDGSTTRTITDSTLSGGTAGSANPVYTVTGKDKAVIDKSADGLSTTTQWDLTGSGTFTEHQTEATTLHEDGSTTNLTSYYVGTTLKSRVEVWRSADGLTKATKWDTTGSGVFDQLSVYTRTVNANGTVTEVTTNTTGSGTVLSKTTVTTSADGLTVTTIEDTDGSGSAVRSRTVVTSILADGTTVVTTSNYNPGGSLHDRTVTQTSGDGLTVSGTFDADGNGTTDQTKLVVTAVDGSSTTTITDLGAGGTVKSKSTISTSFDGLVTSTNNDFNGDGAMNATGQIDRTISDTLVANADGSSTETTQVKRYFTATPALIETITTSVSADGRTTTTTVDVDGNGSTDETSTTVTKINGSTVTTTTDNAAARATDPSVGGVFWTSAVATSLKTVAASTITTVDADQLGRTITADYDGNGTYEHVESWKQLIDGSQVGTITDVNASSVVVARGRETISADGLVTTLIEDTTNSGKINHKETAVTGRDGSKVKTVIDLNTDGTWQKTVVTTVSPNGQTVTPVTTNGPGSAVTISTSNSTNNYWGISGTAVVSGASNAIGVSNAVDVVTLNGNNNIINESGGEILTVNGTGTGKRLQVFNRDNVAMIASSTVEINNNAALTLLGSSNTIKMFDNSILNVWSGTGETLTVDGVGASATISSATIQVWDDGSLYLNGTGNNVTIFDNSSLTASGVNSLTVDGSGAVAAMSNSSIYMWDNRSLTLTGSSNDILLYENTTLTLNDGGNDITVVDNLSHIIGDGQTITLHTGLSLDVNGAGNYINVWDDATLTLHGNWNHVELYDANVILTDADNEIDINSNGGFVQGDGENINVSAGITGTVDGTNNGINLDHDTSVVVNDAGNSVYAWGSDSYAMISNGTVNVEDGAALSVDGTGNQINLGQDGAVVVMQNGNTLEVQGTDGYASVNYGTVNVDNGSGSTLDGSHNDVYMGHDSWVNAIGSYDSFHFGTGFGHDGISGFDATGTDADDVYIDDAVFANWSTLLSHATQSGSDVIITQDASNAITLYNTTKTSLQQSHFHFV